MKRFIKGTLLVLAALPAVARANSTEPEPLIGVGTRLSFTRDLQFSGGNSAIFCGGKPAGVFESVTAPSCCELKVGVPVKMMSEITVKADRPHVVNFVNDIRTLIMIDVNTESTVRCRSQRISVEVLKRGFGDTLRIEELVPPPEPSKEMKIEI